MQLSEDNRNTLMVSIHKIIDGQADKTANRLAEADLDNLLIYPPKAGFTNEEEQALMRLRNDNNLRSAFRKILAHHSANVVLDFLELIDGTVDPEDELGEWSGVAIVDLNEDVEENEKLLHEGFITSFREWKEIRPYKGWELDAVDE